MSKFSIKTLIHRSAPSDPASEASPTRSTGRSILKSASNFFGETLSTRDRNTRKLTKELHRKPIRNDRIDTLLRRKIDTRSEELIEAGIKSEKGRDVMYQLGVEPTLGLNIIGLRPPTAGQSTLDARDPSIASIRDLLRSPPATEPQTPADPGRLLPDRISGMSSWSVTTDADATDWAHDLTRYLVDYQPDVPPPLPTGIELPWATRNSKAPEQSAAPHSSSDNGPRRFYQPDARLHSIREESASMASDHSGSSRRASAGGAPIPHELTLENNPGPRNSVASDPSGSPSSASSSGSSMRHHQIDSGNSSREDQVLNASGTSETTYSTSGSSIDDHPAFRGDQSWQNGAYSPSMYPPVDIGSPVHHDPVAGQLPSWGEQMVRYSAHSPSIYPMTDIGSPIDHRSRRDSIDSASVYSTSDSGRPIAPGHSDTPFDEPPDRSLVPMGLRVHKHPQSAADPDRIHSWLAHSAPDSVAPPIPPRSRLRQTSANPRATSLTPPVPGRPQRS